jgi:hypothetical protein
MVIVISDILDSPWRTWSAFRTISVAFCEKRENGRRKSNKHPENLFLIFHASTVIASDQQNDLFSSLFSFPDCSVFRKDLFGLNQGNFFSKFLFLPNQTQEMQANSDTKLI